MLLVKYRTRERMAGDRTMTLVEDRARVRVGRSNIDDIADKVYAGERLTFEEGVRLFHHPNLPELASLAHFVREKLHPDTNSIVTYVVGRNINYTNVCWVRCKFC